MIEETKKEIQELEKNFKKLQKEVQELIKYKSAWEELKETQQIPEAGIATKVFSKMIDLEKKNGIEKGD